MNDIVKFEELLRDFDSAQARMGQQVAAFQKLQNKVAQLQQRAPHDPQASEQLARLNQALGSEYADRRDQLINAMKRTHTALYTLQLQFKQFGGDGSSSGA